MIFVGYPCIGKSSCCGGQNIDLKSETLFIDSIRPGGWEKIYCNMAVDLDSQGYNVFLSSHDMVVDNLIKSKIPFIAIYPHKTADLKDLWIKKAENRYLMTNLEKDKRALDRIKNFYESDINSLMEKCNSNSIVLCSDDYNLKTIIRDWKALIQ